MTGSKAVNLARKRSYNRLIIAPRSTGADCPSSTWLDKYPQIIVFAHFSRMQSAPSNANTQGAVPPMSRNLSRKSPYAVIPILLGLSALVEARHPFPLFRLATFTLAFLALAGMASLLRGKLRDGFVVLASLAFGLSIIEATATIRETKELYVGTNGFFFPQPDIGWGPQHPGRFHAEKTDPKSGIPIYSVDYTIDSNLLRETHSAETGPTIVFFGDSFTFGLGLNDAETLPQVFADLLGRKQRVLNLGFSAYGPQEFLAELQTGRFDGVIGAQPRLFIFMTMPEHAERTACKPFWVRWGPRYALENGRVALKGACYDGLSLWVREWLEDMASYRLFIELYRNKISQDDVDLYIRILVAAVNLAQDTASRLSFLISRGLSISRERVSAMTQSSRGCGTAVPWSSTFLSWKTNPPVQNSLSKATAIQRRWRTALGPRCLKIISKITCLGFWLREHTDWLKSRQSGSKAFL